MVQSRLTTENVNISNHIVTRSHEMSLNLKFGNLRYLHVSNLHVLLVIFILKSPLYSKKCGCDVFLNGLHVWRRHIPP